MRRILLVPLLIVACSRGDTPAPPPDPFSGIELATVPAPLAEVPSAAVVITSKTAIVVDGKPVVPIVNGKIDASEKEGGELGRKLLHLQAALTGVHDDLLVLAIDRATPYSLLVDEIYTAKAKPLEFRRFAIVADVGDKHARTALITKLPEMQKAAVGTLLPAGHRAPVSGSRVAIADSTQEAASSLTPEIVLAKIQAAYMSGIKRCYTSALAKDPHAHGELALQLSVGADGRAFDARATGLVGACVTPLMQTWRFPQPKPATVTFKIALKLMPDDEPAKDRNAEAEHVADKRPAMTPEKEPTPDIKRVAALLDAIPPPPLRLVVTETAAEFMLWSFDGSEGTLQAPKLRVSHADPEAPAKIRTALTEIVTRRFSGHLPETQREIIFMASGDEQAASFIPMMAAIHAVIPDILLSSGVE